MKQNLLAVVLAFSAVGLVGCAELQQQVAGVQQPAQPVPQQVNASTTNGQSQAATQQQQPQPQESSFLGDLIKTATETLGSEAKGAVQSTIRGAVRN